MSGTESLHSSLPREMKMPCGCFGEYRQGNTQTTWLVTVEAFLCPMKHKQGQVVVVKFDTADNPEWGGERWVVIVAKGDAADRIAEAYGG